MANRKRMYDETHVVDVKRLLKEGREQRVPRRKRLSTSDLVHAVRKDIEKLRKEGFTVEQICSMIAKSGIDASESTLKRYVSTSRKPTSTKPKRNTKKTQAVPPAAPPASNGENRARGVQPPSGKAAGRATLSIRADREDL